MERRYQLEHLNHPDLSLAEPFGFTKGCRTLKIPCPPLFETQKGVFCDPCSFGTLLFDVDKDPKQLNSLNDPKLEQKMIGHMVRLMKENEAPAEQFERMGLEP
jgi:hypothetical protein